MKVKHILSIFILGFIIVIVGALLKILHYQYGNELISIGSILKVIAGIVFIWKLLSSNKFKEFLNW